MATLLLVVLYFRKIIYLRNLRKNLIYSIAFSVHYVIKSKNVKQLQDSISNMIFFITSFSFTRDLTNNYKIALGIF